MEFIRFASLSFYLYFQVNRCIRSQILSHCIPLFFCLFVILTVRCVDLLLLFFSPSFCFHLMDKSVVGKKCSCLRLFNSRNLRKMVKKHTLTQYNAQKPEDKINLYYTRLRRACDQTNEKFERK